MMTHELTCVGMRVYSTFINIAQYLPVNSVVIVIVMRFINI